MSIRDRWSTAGLIYAALAAFSLAMLISLAHAIQTGWTVENEHVPNVRAAGRVKLEATLAHLWFEEALSGDRNESLDDVWRLLDSAHFYLQAMRVGAVDAQGPIHPLDDPELEAKIRDVDRALDAFRAITKQRQAARRSAVPGTAIDQQYDEVFERLIALSSDVELRLHEVIRAESVKVRKIQFAVMAGAAILSVLLGLTFRRYTEERKESENALHQKAQAEEEARKAFEQLAHTARLNTMNELAAGIAHEVNQPLTAIMMSAAACRQLAGSGRIDSDELQRAVSTISAQAERAANVIRRLRAFVAKESGAREPADINDLIREVVSLLRFDPRTIQANVELELDENLDPVNVDVVQIQQVVLNLVRNAVEATASSDAGVQPVRVRTWMNKVGEITVSITDEGTGLSESIESQLFQPFTTTKDSGMGMGLSISDSIISAHGGRIWHQHNPDRPGSTFLFTLPVGRKESPA